MEAAKRRITSPIARSMGEGPAEGYQTLVVGPADSMNEHHTLESARLLHNESESDLQTQRSIEPHVSHLSLSRIYINRLISQYYLCIPPVAQIYLSSENI